MEIEITSQTKNPMLNRTDIHFTIQHTGEQTPKRELIRSEIADKLKVKKEQIIVDNMQSHFGISQTQGYAKIYKNIKEAQSYERKHILKRNNALIQEKQKDAKTDKPETKPEPEKEPKQEQPPEPEKTSSEPPSPEKSQEAPPEEKKETP